jgi:hypothetical protein
MGEGLYLGIASMSAAVMKMTLRQAAENRFGAVPETSHGRPRVDPDIPATDNLRPGLLR